MTWMRSSRFSPQLVPPAQLEALFVGRRPLLSRIVRQIEETLTQGGGRYDLVIGPRGAGKTHLVRLILHRVRELGLAVVVDFDEEETPGSYVDLLARLLVRLPSPPGLPSTAEQVTVLRRAPRAEQANLAERMLVARLEGQALWWVVENLDRVLGAIGTDGENRLRRLLQSQLRWSVLGTATRETPAFADPKRSFYKSFSPIELPPFGDHDAHAMLLSLADAHEEHVLRAQLLEPGGFARVRAMRVLLGGNPRAMAFIFPFLRGGRLGDLEGAFYELGEELTPYFQEQMTRLPDGQRVYMEHLASNWRPLTVTELAELTFNEKNTTSGQLRYLRQSRMVTAMAVGRESFYEIAEPLHRLAWAMKQPERLPAAIARFLAVWLREDDIRARWIAAGRSDDRLDPWFTALVRQEPAQTPWENARLPELEGRLERGDEEALEELRAEWLAHRSSGVGFALVFSLLARNDLQGAGEVALGLWRRGEQAAAPAVLMASWRLVGLEEVELAEMARSLLELSHNGLAEASLDVLVIWPLLCMRGLPEAIRREVVGLVRLHPPPEPRLSFLQSIVPPDEVWARVADLSLDTLVATDRMHWLSLAVKHGAVPEDAVLLRGLSGADRARVALMAAMVRGDGPASERWSTELAPGDFMVMAAAVPRKMWAGDVMGALFAVRDLVEAHPESASSLADTFVALRKHALSRGESVLPLLDLLDLPPLHDATWASEQRALLRAILGDLAGAHTALDLAGPTVSSRVRGFLSLLEHPEAPIDPSLDPDANDDWAMVVLVGAVQTAGPQLLVRLRAEGHPAWAHAVSRAPAMWLGALAAQRRSGLQELPASLKAWRSTFADLPLWALVDAFMALPADLRPYATLAAAERAAFREVISVTLPEYIALLPPEPEP
jgi:DNA-binding transcriptional ArsR family regulator